MAKTILALLIFLGFLSVDLPAQELHLLSGQDQTLLSGTVQPVTFAITDGEGNPLSGIPVVLSGDTALFDAVQKYTDLYGTATFDFTAPTVPHITQFNYSASPGGAGNIGFYERVLSEREKTRPAGQPGFPSTLEGKAVSTIS